jgi:uncharacterized membrane protein
MTIFLSCGPILEPLIGMAGAIIICIILITLAVKKIKKSNYYQNEFKKAEIIKKSGLIALFLMISATILYVVFFMSTMLLTFLVLMIEGRLG